MAHTVDATNAGSTETFLLEVQVNNANNNETRTITLPGSTTRGEGDLYKFDISDFGFTSSCIRQHQIYVIAITVPDSTDDGWYIDSVVTFVGDNNGIFQLETIDIDLLQRFDTDNLENNPVTRYELTMA